MNLKTLSLLCTFFVGFLSFVGWASGSWHVEKHATQSQNVETEDTPDNATETQDDNDEELRENPQIEKNDDDDIGITIPDFINENSNHIIMNGADWSRARKKLANSSRKPFSVVHIGDSHLQADISSGTIREMMQYDHGNAGRGLVIPFRMASTNEPWDYEISSHKGWHSAKLLKRPWKQPIWFTGLSISPISSSGDLFVGTKEDNDYNPFSAMIIFHTGKLDIISVENRDNEEIAFSQAGVSGGTLVRLSTEESGVRLHFTSEDCSIMGINLSGQRPGVFYHTIGNNGATYASYNSLPHMGRGVRLLYPDIIVLSLGTNEAFGSFDESPFLKSVDTLVKDLQKWSPDATILLTTPMECQRSVYTSSARKVKKKVRVSVKGKKKYTTRTRTVTQKIRHRGFGINNNVAEVRNAILKYGRQNGISVYDWYDVAGGKGVSTNWINAGLYGSDRIHHTSKGYRLQGYMLYKALTEALNQ